MLNQPTMTVAAFDQLVFQPEYQDSRLEYIGDVVTEVVSNHYLSEIALYIGYILSSFVRTRKLGRITGYIPDVAFISATKQPEPCLDAYNPTPPNLAVEVLSPTDNSSHVQIKVVNYLQAGTNVWVVDPETKRIEIYEPNRPPKTLDENGVIEGGSALSDFQLSVKAVFALE